MTFRAALVPCAALALLAAGCGGGGGNAEPAVVAHVGGRPITRVQLDTTVQHFAQESRLEGHDFPAEGSPAFLKVRRTLLGLLVSRAQVEQAAARIGVHVTQRQVAARLASGAAADPDTDRNFARATVRAQLVQEQAFRRVTRGVSVPDAAVRAYFRSHRGLYGASTFASVRAAIHSELLAQRRNAAMRRWLATTRRVAVAYAKGYGPPQ